MAGPKRTAMKSTALAAMLTAALTAHAAAVERPQDRWNLADLFANADAWNTEAAKLEAQLPQIAACRGRLGESAARMRECFELQTDARKRYARLAVYANELHSEDTGNAGSLALRQRTQVLGSRLGEAGSYVSPEILATGRARIDEFLREEPALAVYRQPLDDILRKAPHTLDGAGEALVAAFALAAGQSGSVYNILSNADMPWPTVRLADGQEVKLDQSAYTLHRESANRDDRMKVMDAFFGKWKEFERTNGVAFYGMLKEDAVYTKIRKYNSTLERKLFANNVPVAVYDALLKATNDNLPTLHRYFRLRGKMLGVPEMRYYDIYPPLVKGGRAYPIDEGIAITLEAVKPLGAEYVSAMKKGFESRWMDVYTRPRKQSGAHMAGAAYDVHPYVLMNYNDNYESVSTLAHEWGHAMHSYFSSRTQPYPTAGYAIFVGEIASTVNEVLLLEHALKIAKSDDERMLYLGSALENLRGTFFRQAMFADFEREVHRRADAGESLTGEQLTRLYGDMLKRYHGDAQGVLKVDDLYAIEWSYIPHFYGSFYVFQYATSIAASQLLADAILRGDAGARARYLKLISSGGSKYPYDLVKEAGVDLATPAPYEALVRRMNGIMDRIEEILARKK
jgi:oligoendopeptidase F